MRNYLLKEIKDNIEKWNTSDIYVISLFVYDEGDNPNQPTVTLGYNTISNYEENIDDAWDEEEAKWNFAFWLQNEEYVFGVDETRPIVEKWIQENNYIDEDDDMIVTNAFVKVLVDIVKELHQSGFIKEKFGKAIPVIIHELEYYEEIANQNIEANGYELVEEFVNFCNGF
jgi:hypothetical protein